MPKVPPKFQVKRAVRLDAATDKAVRDIAERDQRPPATVLRILIGLAAQLGTTVEEIRAAIGKAKKVGKTVGKA